MAIGYVQLTDADILAMPVDKLQTDGYIMLWVVNSKFNLALQLFNKWGYT